jgi:hypothetical protein
MIVGLVPQSCHNGMATVHTHAYWRALMRTADLRVRGSRGFVLVVASDFQSDDGSSILLTRSSGR